MGEIWSISYFFLTSILHPLTPFFQCVEKI